MQLHQKVSNKLKNNVQNIAFDKVNSLDLPNSLLIIPDGNGRWAKSHNLPISEGHKEGGKTIATILDYFLKINIKVLGIWGFSEDNWKRPKEEIDKIMEIIEITIAENLEKMIKNDIKFIVLGKKDRLENEYPSLSNTIAAAMEKTTNCTTKTLALFIDYGEKFQLEEFSAKRAQNPNIATYDLLSEINLGLPLFDMVLRTSGELRLSGFGPLASIAEFISVSKNLPEFTQADLIDALYEYSQRERRLGARL